MSMNPELIKDLMTLRSQGFSEEQLMEYIKMKETATAEPEMSQRDKVVISQSEGNAPGAYVDSYSKAQDAFGQMMMANDRLKQQQAAIANQELNGLTQYDMYGGTPNVKIESEGQQVTATPDGRIIFY